MAKMQQNDRSAPRYRNSTNAVPRDWRYLGVVFRLKWNIGEVQRGTRISVKSRREPSCWLVYGSCFIMLHFFNEMLTRMGESTFELSKILFNSQPLIENGAFVVPQVSAQLLKYPCRFLGLGDTLHPLPTARRCRQNTAKQEIFRFYGTNLFCTEFRAEFENKITTFLQLFAVTVVAETKKDVAVEVAEMQPPS